MHGPARQVHPISKLIWQGYYYYYNKNNDKKAGQISLVLDLFIFCWVGRQIWFRSFIRCEMRFLKSIKRNGTRISYSGNKRIFPSFQERKRKKSKQNIKNEKSKKNTWVTLLPQTACRIWNTNPVHLYIYTVHTYIVFVFILFGFTQVARLRPFFCIGAHFHHRFRVFVYLFFHTGSSIYIRPLFFLLYSFLFIYSLKLFKNMKTEFYFLFRFYCHGLFLFSFFIS